MDVYRVYPSWEHAGECSVSLWTQYTMRHPGNGACHGHRHLLTPKEVARLHGHALVWNAMCARGRGGLVSENDDPPPPLPPGANGDVVLLHALGSLTYVVRTAAVARRLLERGTQPMTVPVDVLLWLMKRNGELSVDTSRIQRHDTARRGWWWQSNAKAFLPDVGGGPLVLLLCLLYLLYECKKRWR